MTPNILKVMGWFKESSEFMWFDLGEINDERNNAVNDHMEKGDTPLVLHSQTLPQELPMPFEQMGTVVDFIDTKNRHILTCVTFDRVENDMQIVFRHPVNSADPRMHKLILTQVGEKSIEGDKDLWYDGEMVDELVKLDRYKDKSNPEQEVVSLYTDIARTVYATLYLDLVNKKIRTPAYQPTANPSNAKRMAKGKKPLFEWKVIDITANHVLPENSPPTGRTHASPRRHVRRGHMRTYKSGKKAWVKQTMVGKIEFGYIHHSYTAQGGQHATT